MFKCAICGAEFEDEHSLVLHVKKEHGLKKAEYYETHVPRYNKLTGQKIVFKDTDSYFTHDFDSRKQISMWCAKAPAEEVKAWLLESLAVRAKRKGDKYAPCSVELQTVKMADISIYEKFFGSYDVACALVGLEPRLKTVKPKSTKKLIKDIEILIDTREQKPLSFSNSVESKLSVGDYTLSGDNFSNTYIDRKSENDFRGTMSSAAGFDRFCREVERAIALDCYLIVLIEAGLEKIGQDTYKDYGQASPEHAFRNMRKILELYPRKVQFIFSGNRKNSEYLVPILLQMGQESWEYDMNYIINKSGVIK